MRQKVITRNYAWCAHVFTQNFTNIELIGHCYVMTLSLKFHKNLIFCCRNISKITLNIRGVQKIKMLDSKLAPQFFPLHGISGVTTKNFSPLDQPEQPPLATPIFIRGHQRKIPANLQSGHLSAPVKKLKKIKGLYFL